MTKLRKTLIGLALFAVQAAAQAASPAPHALAYGQKYFLRRGAFIAVSETSLRRLFQAFRTHDSNAIARLVERHEVESLIRDAIATPVASHGGSFDVVEVQIPGFIGTVVTPRMNLIAR